MSTLLITRGDTVSLQFTITQGGAAMNLTGCNVWFTVKTYLSDDDSIALIQKNVTGTDADGDVVETGVTVPTPTNGIALLTLQNADTQPLVPNNPSTLYYYDVQVEDADGNVFTALVGRLQVQTDVTQSV